MQHLPQITLDRFTFMFQLTETLSISYSNLRNSRKEEVARIDILFFLRSFSDIVIISSLLCLSGEDTVGAPDTCDVAVFSSNALAPPGES